MQKKVEAILEVTGANSFMRTFDEAARGMEQFEKRTNSTGGGIEKATSKFRGFADGVGKIATAVGVTQVVSAGVRAINGALDGAITRVDRMNAFPRVMSLMGFSAEDAEKAVNTLSDGIQGLPTALDEILASTQNIAILTGDMEGATETALALNNAFLMSGSSSADASRGLTQYVQMLSRGEVDMQSWRTLQETMGPALMQTAEAFGFAGAAAQNDLYDALKNGDITFDEFNGKLIELSNATGGFADMAQEASGGIRTSMANIRTAIVRNVANAIQAVDDAMVAGGFGSISENLDRVKNLVDGAFKKIVEFIPPVMNAIVDLYNTVKESTAFQSLGEAVDVVRDAIGKFFDILERSGVLETVKGYLSDLAQALLDIDFAKNIRDTIAFLDNWSPLIAGIVGGIAVFKTLTAVMSGVTFAINGLKVISQAITGFKIAISVFGGLKGALAVLIPAMTGLSLPILGIAAAIAAAIAVGVALWKNWDTIKAKAIEVWGGLVEFFSGVWDSVSGFFTSAWDSITEYLVGAWQSISTYFSDIWSGIVESAKNIWSGITEYFSNLWSGVESATTSAWQSIVDWLTGAWQSVIDFATPIWNGLVTVISVVWEVIKTTILVAIGIVYTVISGGFTMIRDFIQSVWNSILEFTTPIWEGIKNAVSNAIQAISDFVMPIVDAIKNFILSVWDIIVQRTTSVYENIKSVIVTVWTVVRDFVVEVATKIWDTISGAWNKVSAVTTSVWNSIKTTVTNVFNQVREVVTNVLTTIGAFFTEKWNAILSVVKTVWNNIKTTVSNVANAIWSFISSIFTKIANFFTSIWNSIKSTVSSVWNGIKSTISSISSGIMNTLSSWLNNIKSKFTTMWNSLSSAVSGAFGKVRNAVSSGIQSAYNIITGWIGRFRQAGANVVQSIADGITGAIGKVTGAISNVASKIRNFLPFSPAKEGPLQDLNKLNFGGTISDAIYSGERAIQRAMDSVIQLPEIDASGLSSNMASVNRQLQHEISYDVNVANQRVQPLELQVSIGDSAYKVFVDDISQAQGRAYALEELF